MNNKHLFQFEWAWQQPKESRRLRHMDELKRRKAGESFFDLNFRILTEMLRTPPWNRLPLTIRWLSPQFARDFPVRIQIICQLVPLFIIEMSPYLFDGVRLKNYHRAI